MQVFDFNIHLPYVIDEDVNEIIANDMNLDADGLRKGFAVHQNAISAAVGCNVQLFKPRLFDEHVDLKNIFPRTLTKFTALIDFRRHDLIGYLERAHAAGIHAIMFNSYLQQISDADFLQVYKACKFAEEKGLIICIDGSFGTSKMYAYDNVRLACFIADLISKTPIVIIHSGGKRLLDMMLLAIDKKNVWLDTSFSLPYYVGSSIDQDFAFAYKKIGCDRIVYGSDHPYIPYTISLDIHRAFFARYRFTEEQQHAILAGNAIRLFGA